MALKDTWIPKVDGVDDASAKDINDVARAIIELEQEALKTTETLNTKPDKENPEMSGVLNLLAKNNAISHIAMYADIAIAEIVDGSEGERSLTADAKTGEVKFYDNTPEVSVGLKFDAYSGKVKHVFEDIMMPERNAEGEVYTTLTHPKLELTRGQNLTEEEKQTVRENIGLENVDNTSDKDKPISAKVQDALDKKASKTEVSNALCKAVSGEVIRIDDVSPLVHTVKAKLDASPLVDMYSVTLDRYGKNLLPFPYYATEKESGGVSFKANADGTITVNSDASTAVDFILLNTNENRIRLVKGETYCLSCNVKAQANGEYYIYIQYDNGSDSSATTIQYNGVTDGTCFTPTEDVYLRKASLIIQTARAFSNEIFAPQLELGERASKYEMFSTKTYTPDTEGMVEIDSLLPCMTLLTNTSGVNIECEYNQDANKVVERLTRAIISLGGNV